MRTWREIEAEFRALGPALAYARLDVQWGNAGDHWRLAGTVIDPVVRARFTTIAHLAGRKLKELDPESLPEEARAIADDVLRWVTVLRKWSPGFELGQPAKELDETGETLGWIFTGSLAQPAEAAAVVCLWLESEGKFATTEIERLLAGPSLIGAAAHWERAHLALDADPPDTLTAGKEAVSALEAVAKHVTGIKKGTLGDCLTRLRSDASTHPSLVRSLEGVWGFVNDSPGVRHGSPETPSLSRSELQYVLATCEAGMVLLLSSVA